MADRIKIEVKGRLVPILLRLSKELGRDPDEVIEEALSLYFRSLGTELGPDIGKDIRETYVGPPGDPGRFGSLEELFEHVDKRRREAGVEPLSELTRRKFRRYLTPDEAQNSCCCCMTTLWRSPRGCRRRPSRV